MDSKCGGAVRENAIALLFRKAMTHLNNQLLPSAFKSNLQTLNLYKHFSLACKITPKLVSCCFHVTFYKQKDGSRVLEAFGFILKVLLVLFLEKSSLGAG